jgi:hypothetical protein
MSIRMHDGSDAAFVAACEKAGVKPTRRQYKKWQRKEGSAYTNGQ